MAKITPSSAPENFSFEPVQWIMRDVDIVGDRLLETRATLERDPTKTPQGRALALSEWATARMKTMEGLFGRAIDALNRREQQLQAEITGSWRGAMVSTLEEGEIRSAFRHMEDRAKAREIALAAILRKDTRTMKALQNDPGYLAGFDVGFKDELASRWTLEHYPEARKELKSLEVDAQKLTWAANSLRKEFDAAAAAGAEPSKAAAATAAALAK